MRLPHLTPEQQTPDQKKVYERMLGGKRAAGRPNGFLTRDDGSLVGPFNAWLHSPAVGNRIQALGEQLRFSNSLPDEVYEIAILVTARRWAAQFEGWAHERLARNAGVSEEIVRAIRDERKPAFDDERQDVVFRFSEELLETTRVTDGLYQEALERLGGEQQVMDLVSLLGYYGLVSMTLNVFQVELPEGVAPLYDEPGANGS